MLFSSLYLTNMENLLVHGAGVQWLCCPCLRGMWSPSIVGIHLSRSFPYNTVFVVTKEWKPRGGAWRGQGSFLEERPKPSSWIGFVGGGATSVKWGGMYRELPVAHCAWILKYKTGKRSWSGKGRVLWNLTWHPMESQTLLMGGGSHVWYEWTCFRDPRGDGCGGEDRLQGIWLGFSEVD